MGNWANFAMNYQIIPVGGVWENGMFSVPKAVADKYIKLASEYQIKALLIILSKSGVASSAEIAKRLGITRLDAENIMDFWVAEGVVSAGAASASAESKPVKQKEANIVSENKPEEIKSEHTTEAKKKIKIVAPTLTPKDIIARASENPEIEELLNEAQKAYGRLISHSEREMLVNLIDFYGMKFEVILMLLVYCRNERQAGRAISPAYLYKIAEKWIEAGIETASDAEAEILELEKCDELWMKIREHAELKSKKPTVGQREMIGGWKQDFSLEMIFLAIDEMKENIDSPSLKYVDKILKSWKKENINTPADAEKSKAAFERKKDDKDKNEKKAGTISRKPTYDLEKIKKDALNNTEIKY